MRNHAFINQLKNSFPSDLENISDEDAKNTIIYGISCYKIDEYESIKGSLFLSVNEENTICFANIKNDNIESINIQNINKISFNVNKKDLLSHGSKNKNEKFFEIIINQTYYIFSVENFNKLLLLIKGLLLIFNRREQVISDKNLNKRRSNIENEIDKIINLKMK